MPKAPKWINDTLETILSPKMPLVKVVETEYINTNIKRIRLQGDLKNWHCHAGYATAVRVNDTEYRNYTPAFNDIENGIVELIIHLHGVAPGSRYIDALMPGDELRLVPPRGKKLYNETVKQYFLFGDETTLALACAMQEKLKSKEHQFHFYFELDVENNNIPRILGLDNYSVFSKNNTFVHAGLVHELPLFQTAGWNAGNFILTGNATSVQTIRRVLKQLQVSGSIMAQAYWAAGKTGL
jgi:NAD(P)H-flavin reductase